MAAGKSNQPTGKPHILIMRLSAMGDVAILPPVVKALRQSNPDLKITILTRPAFQIFFRGIENLDFLSPDFTKQYRGLRGIIRLRKEIVRIGITHIADVHDVLRTKVLRKMLRIRRLRVAVIDKGRDEKRALTRKYHKYMVQLKPSYERYRDTIIKLGFKVDELKPVRKAALPVPEEILEITGPKKGRWIGIAPFAKHVGKIYPTSLSGELIGLLSAKFAHVFIFGGGAYEKEYAECMDERYTNVHSVIGKLRLGTEMDLISNIDVMVTMDSATMHIASLVGTPVVSVWGSTHPFAGFYGFGQDPDNAVQLELSCRPCSVYGNKQCLYNDYRCLHRIAPQTIFDKVVKVAGKVDSSEKQTRKGSCVKNFTQES